MPQNSSEARRTERESRPGVQGKDGVGTGKGRPSTAHRKSDVRSKIFRELVHIAAEQGASIPLGISTADALQECLDRAVSLMRFAQDAVDALHTGDGEGRSLEEIANDGPESDPLYVVIPNPQGPDLIEPHRYFKMEREARMEVEKLAGMMTQLGIAERVVRVREAEAALLVGAIREAAFRAGFDNGDIKKLGSALRDVLDEGPREKAHWAPDGARHQAPEINRTLDEAINSTAEELYAD